MAIDKKLQIFDNEGNPVDYDILASDVKFLPDGKDLPTKLAEMQEEIDDAGGGYTPPVGGISMSELSQEVQDMIALAGTALQSASFHADWAEKNMNSPAYIRSKPSLADVALTGSYNDLKDKPTIPDGVECDAQMSSTSEKPVQNKVIKAYVDNLINGLVNGAPAALDTLNELADALGDNDDAIAALTTALAGKVSANGDEYLQVKAGATKGATAIQGVIVNGAEATKDSNDKVSISVPQGESGITPHIDAVTGHWFIGDEDTNVPATGPQGNSGVASGDDVVVVNNLNGEPSDLESGKVAVLSAEQGKFLGDRTLIGTGIFGDAYDKAMQLNVPFPWLLDDTDDQGNKVKKMMWHAGNCVFIDAIGGEVSGDRNGLTIECLKPCTMKAFNDERTNTLLFSKQLNAGINFFTLDEIADNIQDSGQSNKTLSRLDFYDTEGVTRLTNAVKKIDFGGLALNGGGIIISSNPKNFLDYQTELTVVKRMNLVNNNIKGITNILAGCAKLSYLGLSGSILYTGTAADSYRGFLSGDNVIQTLDLSGLSVESSILVNWFNAGNAVSKSLQYLDISGIDFSKANDVTYFCNGQTSLVTLIVGNFSNANVSSVSGAFGNRFRSGNMHTLVCRCKYPPEMVADASTPSDADTSIDFLYRLSYYYPNTFGNGNGVILVPPGSKQYYDVATVWSDYSAIIVEFNEGDYEVIDNTPSNP